MVFLIWRKGKRNLMFLPLYFWQNVKQLPCRTIFGNFLPFVYQFWNKMWLKLFWYVCFFIEHKQKKKPIKRKCTLSDYAPLSRQSSSQAWLSWLEEVHLKKRGGVSFFTSCLLELAWRVPVMWNWTHCLQQAAPPVGCSWQRRLFLRLSSGFLGQNYT